MSFGKLITSHGSTTVWCSWDVIWTCLVNIFGKLLLFCDDASFFELNIKLSCCCVSFSAAPDAANIKLLLLITI